MKICVFGASNNEILPEYIQQTEDLGQVLAEHDHELIFGGGGAGLMGAIARGFKKGNGKIIGVCPTFFNEPGKLYEQCDEMIWTKGLADRKDYMITNADAFIVTPGGAGTFDEFYEVLTNKQIGGVNKPLILFNSLGFFDSTMTVLKEIQEKGFLKKSVSDLVSLTDDINQVLNLLNNE